MSVSDPGEYLSARARSLDGSGARLLFELQRKIPDPIDLSIGQPDFDVPEVVKEAAVRAIREGFNAYTDPQGIVELQECLRRQIAREFPDWHHDASGSGGFDAIVTSGVTGGLILAFVACVDPGDEVLLPDPYFMSYGFLSRMFGATPVCFDTYPDFEVTAERIEPYVTDRTRLLVLNSPSNPTGAVMSEHRCREIAELCDRHGILVVSDEIYEEFCFEPVERAGRLRAPSIASYTRGAVVLRGFSKSYGMTGWRLGYAAGPRAVVEKMAEAALLYFVCAPTPAQVAGVTALELAPRAHVERYRRNRDRLLDVLSPFYDVRAPAGAFYAFVPVPEHLGMTGTEFVTKAVLGHRTLLVPGGAFSARDSHFRISFACDAETLERGLEVLVRLAAAPDVRAASASQAHA